MFVGAAEANDRKTVLILYGERLDLPAIRAAEQSLRESFAASTSPPVDWFAEYFDFARFPAAEHDANLTNYLKARYAGRRIDLVMPVSSLSLRFVLRHREEVFPGVPVVYGVQSVADVDMAALPADVIGVAAEIDVRGTVDLALRLQPEAREIVCVAGASAADQDALAHVLKVLESYADRLRVRTVTKKSLAETVKEVCAVPRGEIVLLVSLMRDTEGRALSTRDVARQLAPISQAPIYGFTGTLIDTGAVGGALVDFAATGRQAAGVALKVLNGGRVPLGSPETKSPTPLVVDWRALQHWKLSPSRVPAEAKVMFRQPTLWEEHRGFIIGVAAVLLMQTALIAGLIAQRAWRRRLEREAVQLRQELTHAGRVAMLGELSGSLAHELNQPLMAILSNAQAAQSFLAKPEIDRAEMGEILDDIVDADKHAGEVIRRLRVLLKKGEVQSQSLDLNEVVQETLKLVRSDLVNRNVTIETELAPGVPSVRGDRVQLQQVLLNLVMNACDAMVGCDESDRRLGVRTERMEGDGVRVSVRDCGHGIPAEARERIFTPFFTTKPQGLGLGLGVCRSILTAHGGELSAENNPDRGARFYFVLPADHRLTT
jgi:signal transduction histidine kinase